jgi:hypothetical protein
VVVPGAITAALIGCVAALTLGGCGHDELPPFPRDILSREESAASLLRIELDARLLRHRADVPGIEGHAARIEALDSLLEHIRRTSGFLAEGKSRAGTVGIDLAGVTYDLMRADFEATVRGISGPFRSPCNRGIAWAGVGIQGLEEDPGWADRTEEVEQALGNAIFHRDNVFRTAPIANILKSGVAAGSITTSAISAAALLRTGVAALGRLGAWIQQGGAAFGALQAVPGGAGAIQLVAGSGAIALTHAEVMALATAGQLSATAASLYMMAKGQPPKVPQSKAFTEWSSKLPAKQTPANSDASRYEIAKAGPRNYQVKGAGEEPIWADGLRASDGHVLEAKYVGDAARSPYVDGSACPEFLRAKTLVDLEREFQRYAAVIRDRSNPVVGLEVIVSDVRAVPLFERLLSKFSIPGQVIVLPP